MYATCLKPQQESSKGFLGGISGYLDKKLKNPYDEPQQIEEVKVDISGIQSVEDLSELLYKISTELVADK